MNNNPDVPSRPTEGSRPGGNAAMKRQPGRPRGSKNKPKSLVPSELAEQILLRMEDMLPEEHFRYLKGVIKDGKAISTIRELDTLILLLSRNLYPALVHEMLPAEEGGLGGIYRKDVTERLKILQSLLGLRFQIEKKNDDNADEGEQPILKVFAARGIDTDRLSLLVGVKPAVVVGGADNAEWPALRAGDSTDQILERHVSVQDREQGEAVGVLDNPSWGDSPESSDES